jgi:hypothetical protein
VWLSGVANVVGLAAGAVFLFAAPGARLGGMEPQASAFTGLCLLAVLLGVLVGLPASLYDFSRRRQRLWGAVGVLLALTPWLTASVVAALIAEQRGLIFD